MMSISDSCAPRAETYLGLDLGTHALKAVGFRREHSSEYMQQTHAVDIVFDRDLPEFSPAVEVDEETQEATSLPRLFLAAVDAAMTSLHEQDFSFHELRGLSGAAQQHGSVYVTSEFADVLQNMDPRAKLQDERNIPQGCFAFARCPVWLDASTSDECAAIEQRLGGPARVAEVTGSRAYERFTGCQILKRARAETTVFDKCKRVFLVSSFLASVFCGEPVSEDVGDASGTNMFQVESNPPTWWEDAVTACEASGRLSKAPVLGWTLVGSMAPYFRKKYGVPSDAVCCAWSGDNPNTIAGYGGLGEGDVVVSLGTSDTAQWISHSGKGARFGHTFRSPLSKEPEYFRMLCYANGSRTRESVRDGKYAIKSDADCERQNCARSWQEFDDAVESTRPGCMPSAKVAVFYLSPEIVPRCPSQAAPEVRCCKTGELCTASWAELCRLSVESRAMTIAVHGARLEGQSEFQPRRILLTGGGSASRVFPQILADVLNAPVYAYASTASAAAGAAYRARHAWRCHTEGQFVPFKDVYAAATAVGESTSALKLLAKPRDGMPELYKAMLPRFAHLSNPDV